MKEPFISMNAFENTIFNINGETREFNLIELLEMSDMIKEHLNICSYIAHYLNCYKDYENKIDSEIDDMELEINSGDITEFSVGGEFNFFMGLSDNNAAAKKIKKDYTEEYGENTLIFDAEHSYCYVYTKNKAEAKQFQLFTYNNYIKPFLNNWNNGFEQFNELINDSKYKYKFQF